MARLAKTAARGYGGEHQKLRKRWAAIVAAGQVNCWRCGRWIAPRSRWELGHSEDRTRWMGPECFECNRGARRGRPLRKRVVVARVITTDRW
jgi:hypothetical protein